MNPSESPPIEENLSQRAHEAVNNTSEALRERMGKLSPEARKDVEEFTKQLGYLEENSPVNQMGTGVEAHIFNDSGERDFIITSQKPWESLENEVRSLYVKRTTKDFSDTFELMIDNEDMTLSRNRVDNNRIEGATFSHEHIL